MRVREAQLDDYDHINGVHLRNGFICLTREEWRHQWEANPAYLQHPDFPIGWVLEDDAGSIVGTFSNIPIAYSLGRTPLLAAVASAWAIDEAWRSSSMELICRYFAQKKVDFFLDTTANDVAAKVMKAFGARSVPGAACDEVLFWVTNYRGAAASFLRRKAVPGIGLVAPFAGTALRLADWWGNKCRRKQDTGMVREIDDFDDRFNGLWESLQEKAGKLLAVRDQATLRWHFQFSLSRGTAAILALEDAGRLAGYAVLIRQDEGSSQLRRLRLADMQVLDNKPAHVEALFESALRYAEERRIHLVEVVGHDPSKRDVMRRFGPRQRALPIWSYWCKPANPSIDSAVFEPRKWDVSPFDGDASLFTFSIGA